MFRTSNIRGQQRFTDLRQSNLNKRGLVNLNANQVEYIENTSILSLGEKINLLLVSLGNKLTTELYMNIRYTKSDLKKPEEPNKNDVHQIKKLLEKLPFTYYKDSLSKKNKQSKKIQNFAWFQVSVNEAVSRFMKKYPDDLTEFEEGILYGFPLSAIRSFSRLIEARHDNPNPATYFLSGWCSKDFWDDEQEYYQKWWNRLAKLSPKIVKEAETEYYKNH